MSDILDAIDAAVDSRCACGCGTALDPNGPSGWFVNAEHQRRYQEQHATDPQDVYSRPDAAVVLVGADDRAVPLDDATDAERNAFSYACARLYAIAHACAVEPALHRQPALTRHPGPEPPTTGEPWRWMTDKGFRPATAEPLTYRRHCRACRELTIPDAGCRPIMPTFDALSIASPDMVVPLELTPEHQWCRKCLTRYPGPILRAQWRLDGSQWSYELHLSGGGWSLQRRIDQMTIEYAVANADVAAVLWQDMEARLLDEITYRAPCSVADCDKKARRFFTVNRRLDFAGQAWQPGDLNVCPRHESDLRRLEEYPWQIPTQRR